MRTTEDLLACLNSMPMVKSRVERMIDIVENKNGNLVLADDVEERIDEEIKALAREVMQGWAEAEDTRQSTALRQNYKVTSDGKKNSAGIPNTVK
jgi:hypothetical protein